MKIRKRRYTQLISAVLYNCNITGFMKGSIYKGELKGICAPGINCYSCPGAVTSCPLGSLQAGLLSSKYKLPYFILGTIILMGLFLGRFICGFLCPFGLLQELIYKLPLPKLRKNRATRILSYLKYVILIFFVIAIPLIKLAPGFCKYICPAGTLEAGLPLLITNGPLRAMIGFLFSWKFFILSLVLLLCMVCYRLFCRFICPLGAIYSFFSPVAIVGVKVDADKCSACGRCVNTCKMDIRKVGDRECISCGDCISNCPENAIYYKTPLRKKSETDQTI